MNKIKKHLSITKVIVIMIIVQAIFHVSSALNASGVFFSRELGQVYNETNQCITGAATGSVWEYDMYPMAEKVNEIVLSMDDPVALYKNNKTEYFKQFEKIEGSEIYKQVWFDLNAVRKETVASSIDYVLIYPDKNFGVYIMDISGANILPCGDLFELDTSKYRENYKEFHSYISQSPIYGRVNTDGIAYYIDPQQGLYSYLTADIPISRILIHTRMFFLQCLGVSALSTIIISIIAVLIIRRIVVKPVKELQLTAEKFVDDYEERYDTKNETHIFDKVKGGGIRELTDLSSALQSMELEMNSYMKDLDNLTREKIRIGTELSLAEKIQANMLPAIFPPFPERDEFSIFASMTPAKEIGGDLYDFFLVDDDHLCLVIADVAGKGIPAALFMTITKTLINSRIKTGETPAEALGKVNEQIYAGNKEDMFVTVWLAVLNLKTGKGVEVNAGHEHPAIRRANGKFELAKYRHTMAVGSWENIAFKEHEFELHEGDTLFVYTDGVPEAINENEEQFGTDRMLDALNENPDATCEELLQRVHRAVDTFAGETPQFDDLTMLAVKMEQKK